MLWESPRSVPQIEAIGQVETDDEMIYYHMRH
jgi:hypothetical protein